MASITKPIGVAINFIRSYLLDMVPRKRLWVYCLHNKNGCSAHTELQRAAHRLRYRIISPFGQGVAPYNSPEGHKSPFDGAVLLNGLEGILRAGGNVAAGWLPLEMGKTPAVKPNEPQKEAFKHQPAPQACSLPRPAGEAGRSSLPSAPQKAHARLRAGRR